MEIKSEVQSEGMVLDDEKIHPLQLSYEIKHCLLQWQVYVSEKGNEGRFDE